MTPVIWRMIMRMVMFYRWLIFFHRSRYVVSVPLDLYFVVKMKEREHIIKLMRFGILCEVYDRKENENEKEEQARRHVKERERI